MHFHFATLSLLFCIYSEQSLAKKEDTSTFRERLRKLSPSKYSVYGTTDEESQCPERYSKFIGDGWCDNGINSEFNLNIPGCQYDGGDCCTSSCEKATLKSVTSFYCGVAGYYCNDPYYIELDKSTTSTSNPTSNASVLVLSEVFYYGSALLVNDFSSGSQTKRKQAVNSIQVSSMIQYLTWNALDILAANAISGEQGGSSANPGPVHPPKPPRPPLPPKPQPPSSSNSSIDDTEEYFIVSKRGKSDMHSSEVTASYGERWVVHDVTVNTALHQRKYAVATVSWTMSYQTYKYFTSSSSDGSVDQKNVQADNNVDATQQQQFVASFLTSDVLERSLRFSAQAQSLPLYSFMSVCTIQAFNMTNFNQSDYGQFSDQTIEQCLANYTSYSSNQNMHSIDSLYASTQCQNYLSDPWQNFYHNDGYVHWMIAYVILWIFVLLVSVHDMISHPYSNKLTSQSWFGALFGCGLCFSPREATHHLLENEQPGHQNAAQHTAHSSAHPQQSRSSRRHHRRRVLLRVLSLYAHQQQGAGTQNDGDVEQNNQNQSLLAKLWMLLRVPGFFSRHMVSFILFATSSFRISHYIWILAPYFSASTRTESKEYMVCREFAFTMAPNTMSSEFDAISNPDAAYWMDSYLICLWLIAFHTCLSWSLLSAVARHVHVAVRRSMVSLSAPLLPSIPINQPMASFQDHQNFDIVVNQTNPMATHRPLAEGTTSASAMSAEMVPLRPSALVAPAGNALAFNQGQEDSDNNDEAELEQQSPFLASLIPALFNLQIFHFMLICLITVLVALSVIWLVLALSLEHTSPVSASHTKVWESLIGQGVEIFLQWTQRVTGVISMLEAIVLLTVSHWLARLDYLIMRDRVTNNVSADNLLVSPAQMKSLCQWSIIYLATILLFAQGALTILVSHDYFVQTSSPDTNQSTENIVQAPITFSVYSLALRIVELLAVVIVTIAMTQFDDDKQTFTTNNEELVSGSGLSTPYYSEILGNMSGNNTPIPSLTGTRKSHEMNTASKQLLEDNNESKTDSHNMASAGTNNNTNGRSYGMGYGYEGAGPLWLGLAWAGNWQRQHDSLQKPNAVDTNIRSEESDQEERFTWFGWYSRIPNKEETAENRNTTSHIHVLNPKQQSEETNNVSNTSPELSSMASRSATLTNNAPSPFVSFHFPQLSKGNNSTVIVTELATSTSKPVSTNATGTTGVKGEKGNTSSTSGSSINSNNTRASGNWPASLLTRRSISDADKPSFKIQPVNFSSVQESAMSTDSSTKVETSNESLQSTISSHDSLQPSPYKAKDFVNTNTLVNPSSV